MASLTQQTRVWANSGREWRTGEPGVLESMELQRVLVTEQNGVKMQSCWSRLGSNLIWTMSLWKGGDTNTETHTHRENTMGTRRQEWRWDFRSQGAPQIASKLPEARSEAQNRFSLTVLSTSDPVNTLISEQWDRKFLLLKPPRLWDLLHQP